MNKQNFFLLYTIATFTLFCLYGLQSIQPILLEQFALTKFQAALFTTATMLPLGISPLFYGYFLHGKSIKKVLRYSVFYLAIFEFIFACANQYEHLLFIRFLQGMAIPAVLTSLSSYISTHSTQETIQHNMGLYIGATIIGGFSGRFLSALSSEYFGWRLFFILLSLMLFYLCYKLKDIEEVSLKSEQKSIKMMIDTVFDKQYSYLYFSIFFVFFVFSAVLNFLPFELHKEDNTIKPTAIGLVYLGYIMGLIVSFNSKKLKKLFIHERNIFFFAIIVYIFGVALLFQEGYMPKLLSMFVFCLGMFTFHSTASGYINKIASSNKSMVNGIYISAYYIGGTAGSIIPGFFYEHYGWQFFLSFLICLLAIILFIFFLRPREAKA